MRKATVAVIALVLLGGAGIATALLTRTAVDPDASEDRGGGGGRPPPVLPTSGAVPADAPQPTAPEGEPPATPEAAAEAAAARARAGLAPAPRPAPAAPGDSATPSAAPEVVPTAPAAGASPPAPPPPPAVRKSPFGLPSARGRGIGPSGGGPQPTGHWTKYGTAPPSEGRAVLEATVVDLDGQPVHDAEVYLGPPDAVGSEGTSFGDLRSVGRTDARGTLRAERLPAGGVAVGARLGANGLTPRGLDMRAAVGGTLVDGSAMTARIVLPIRVATLGAIEGRVVGPDGAPLSGAGVSLTAFATARTGADGRFRLEHVPAGPASLRASRTGYGAGAAECEVSGGGVATVEFRLPLAETGSLEIAGTVRGPAGEAVPDANVYLLVPADRGTLRSTRTDAAGAFRFEGVPERLRTTAYRVQADRWPSYPAATKAFEGGFVEGPVDLTFASRNATVRLDVLDATTGERIVGARAVVNRVDGTGPKDRPLVRQAASGVYEGAFPAGAYDLRVESIDHVRIDQHLDVPQVGDDLAVSVRLVPRGPPSVEVALEVTVVSAVTGAPVPQARIEVLEVPGGDAFSTLDGARPDGLYRLPARSGARGLRVTAPGFSPHEAPLTLDRSAPEASVRVGLRPN